MLDEPGQFHVVPMPPALGEVAARFAAVDVQLAGDALANNEAFVHEYGDRIGPAHYRHRSLADKLGAEGIERVRRFVADLLRALTGEADRFVWFLDGGLRDDLDDEHSDDRLLISGCVDEARLNGSFVVFSGDRDELAFQVQRLGCYDRVRGIAGPGLTLAEVLPLLTLANPVPTTSTRLSAGRAPLTAVEAVLPITRVFFEEINNGTRLRLISRELSRAQIEEAVTAVRSSSAVPRRWEHVVLRLAPIGVLFTVPPAPRSWTRRRDADAVLARARALSLISMVAEGFPADEALPDVARFDLEAVLTRSEAALLHGEREGDAETSWQVEGAMALAWSLGLTGPLGPTDPNAPGPIQERLMDEEASTSTAPRAGEVVAEEIVYLDAYLAGYERARESLPAPGVIGVGPSSGPLSFESVRWRRAALLWAMDDATSWPP